MFSYTARRYQLPAILVAALAIATAPGKAEAADDSGAEVGMLICESIPGSRVNLVIHSRVDIVCEFKETDGTTEQYSGRTGVAVGVDLHVFQNETLRSAVLTNHFEPGTHQLAGKYAGAKAGVTAGVGGGGALLTGGSNDSIGLKPAITHGTGLGAAAGVGFLVLESKD